jgi:hypothetical protein
MTTFAPPFGNPRIKTVHSFHELVGTPFTGGVNALCWPRTLTGDFAEIVALLGAGDDIDTLDAATLNALPASPAGRAAIAHLIADLHLLRTHGLAPVLDCIQAYPRDENPVGLATDVYSFHADSAPVPADTFLCTYHGPSSEGLSNEQALRRIDDPATRARLLALYGGEDDAGFHVFLSEHCYDLHYATTPDAVPFAFGLGNLWRIAIAYPGCPVPPCIHRAPAQRHDEPRLLLIS